MRVSKGKKGNILIVDDEPYIIRAVSRLLKSEKHNILSSQNGQDAVAVVEDNLVDVVLLDINLPDIDGIEVLKHVKQIDQDIVVIMMTGYGSIKSAVEAMKAGAFEYLTKPFEDNDLIILTVRKAMQFKKLRNENDKLKEMMDGQSRFSNMIGSSASMQRIKRMATRLSNFDSTVLINGESGTGKEVLARNIHFSGVRRNKKFVPIDCGAIPAGIVESELFGHIRGSFTGAEQSSTGLIRLSDQGTAFFDEIGDLPLEMQTRLLRFLQEREVRPVGGTKSDKVDVRVIAATNRNLAQMVENKEFREDLFYRLYVVNIEIPPLRERKEDIPMLMKYFIDKHSQRYGREISFSPAACEVMQNYSWPGNVREVENVVLQLLSLSLDDVIEPEYLPPNVKELASITARAPKYEDIPLSIESYERACLENALKRSNWNVIEAAKLLKLGKSTMYRKMKDLDIDRHPSSEQEQSSI
jgi:two-component system, NtrC family, response regulator